jgi:hypothetical protein
MNDPFVAEQAKRWAEQSLLASGGRESPDHVTDQTTSTDERQPTKDESREARNRIERLYRSAFARGPTQHELEIAIEFLESQAPKHGQSPWHRSLAAWTDFCHLLFNAKEFVFVQ